MSLLSDEDYRQNVEMLLENITPKSRNYILKKLYEHNKALMKQETATIIRSSGSTHVNEKNFSKPNEKVHNLTNKLNEIALIDSKLFGKKEPEQKYNYVPQSNNYPPYFGQNFIK